MRLAGNILVLAQRAASEALVDARTLNTQPSPHVKE